MICLVHVFIDADEMFRITAEAEGKVLEPVKLV